MPELPEIEILKNEINEFLAGKEIVGISINQELTPAFSLNNIEPNIVNTNIAMASRRGKMLCIELHNNYCLLVHLMMVGQLIVTEKHEYDKKITYLIFDFKDNTHLWVNCLPLKYIHFGIKEHIENLPQLKKLGIDPLSKGFTVETFVEKCSKKRGKIKSLLINQTFIAGIGNTYVDEILFNAKVRPDRDVKSLHEQEIIAIYASIKKILKKGIELGGSSEMAFVHLDGSPGTFQNHFQVNHRKGKLCFSCNTQIEKVKVSGKGTYFCPNCQK